jgi:hypothetical protein
MIPPLARGLAGALIALAVAGPAGAEEKTAQKLERWRESCHKDPQTKRETCAVLSRFWYQGETEQEGFSFAVMPVDTAFMILIQGREQVLKTARVKVDEQAEHVMPPGGCGYGFCIFPPADSAAIVEEMKAGRSLLLTVETRAEAIGLRFPLTAFADSLARLGRRADAAQ